MSLCVKINGEETLFESFLDARRVFSNNKFAFSQAGKGILLTNDYMCGADNIVCLGAVELWSGDTLKEKFDAEDVESMVSPTIKAKQASRRPKVAAKVAKKVVSKVKKVAMLDGQKVKKASTSYLVFSNENRSVVKEEMEKAAKEREKVAPKEIMSELGKRWQALEQAKKAVYEEKAQVSRTCGRVNASNNKLFR